MIRAVGALPVLAIAAVAAFVGAASASAASEPLLRGAELYARDCISCHGPEGRGVAPGGPALGAGGIQGAGPPLRGVGARAADFYLRIGYMPLEDAYEQPHRSDPRYDEQELRALVAYVASFGGPPVPRPHPERGDVAEGMHLFTEHCSGCHQIVAEGGVVPGGVAPPLDAATPVQVAEAVRIGPSLMPRFGERQLDERQLDSIVAYVEYAKQPDDRGGWPIGHLGPVPEGLVAWLLAGAVLLLVSVIIGARAER